MTAISGWARAAAVTVMVGALVVAGSAAATAAGTGPALTGPANVGQGQVAVDGRIDLRLATLQALRIAVGGAVDLTGSDKSTLSALITSDLSGLTALRAKTSAETTAAGVRADAQSMIDDYRIYMLVVPKVRFTIAADTEATVITKLQSAHDKLAGIATTLAAAGKDVGSEQAALADMATQLGSATSSINGLAAGLLAVQPSPDASAMQAAVAPVRTGVKSARGDLRVAAADAKTAAAGLKALAT